MGLLFPLFLAGLAGLAIPVWVHLRRRPDKNLVLFSALRFLDEQPLAHNRPLFLQNPLLFLLRCLMLVLLVLSFCFPYLVDAAPEESQAVVFVLDGTLSMNSGDAFQTQAAALQSELEALPPNAYAGVVLLGAEAKIILPVTRRQELPSGWQDQLLPTMGRNRFSAALRAADAMLKPISAQHKSIVVFTDHQANQWKADEALVPFLHPADVQFRGTPPPAQQNAGIIIKKVERTLADADTLIELEVAVTSMQAVPATITVTVGPDQLLEETRQLPAGNEPRVITLRWKHPGQGWVVGHCQVSISDDALTLDDTAAFAVPPILPGKVALLAQSPFLKTALSPEVMHSRWARVDYSMEAAATGPDPLESRTTPNTSGPEPGPLMTPPELQRVDAVCLEVSQLSQPKARQMVKAQVEQGCGILAFLDRVTPEAKSWLAEMEIHPGGLGRARPEASSLAFVLAEHPAFRPFFQSPDFGDLTSLQFLRWHKLKAGPAQLLAAAPDGSPILVETTWFGAPVLVAAFSADRTASSWPADASWVPFLDFALQYIRPRRQPEMTALPGSLFVMEVNAADGTPYELWQGATPLAEAPAKSGHVAFAMPDQLVPGSQADVALESRVLTVKNSQSTEPMWQVALQLPPEESDLRTLESPAAVDAWMLPPETLLNTDSAAENAAEHTAAKSQRVYWHLLLWFGLAAIGETLLSIFSTR